MNYTYTLYILYRRTPPRLQLLFLYYRWRRVQLISRLQSSGALVNSRAKNDDRTE